MYNINNIGTLTVINVAVVNTTTVLVDDMYVNDVFIVHTRPHDNRQWHV